MGLIDREKYNYNSVNVRDEDGKVRKVYSNGDAVANAMLGLSHEDVVKVMKTNGLAEKLGKHVDSPTTNRGQFRMLVGNSLRAKVKRGEPVTIGDHTIKKLDQKIPVAKVETPAKPATKAKEPAKAKESGSRATKKAKAA